MGDERISFGSLDEVDRGIEEDEVADESDSVGEENKGA